MTLVLAISIPSLLHAASVATGVMLIPLIFPPSARTTGLAITCSVGVTIFCGAATYVVAVAGDPLASTRQMKAPNLAMPLRSWRIATPTLVSALGGRRWKAKLLLGRGPASGLTG